MSGVRIVLCMIVKDEAAIIRRCLAAALPHVDGYVICDTGSQDATVDVIHQTALELGVPGRTAHHVWEDFGRNRTLAAEEARAWVTERGWPLDRTYLLFLDADLVLRITPAFEKAALRSTSYQVSQDDGVLCYYNTRLACLSHSWRSVGVTHEYWQPLGGNASSERIESIRIDDLGDGGSKSQKSERDLALLTQGLRDEPGNLRYLFYLAQSLHDLGRWSQAAERYEQRWLLGGWDEERWYARYRQGLCLLRAGESERGAGVLIDAFEERPSRAEPLHALARHYRECGKNDLAFMFACRGLDVSYPTDDVLFVSKGVYEWQLWEEIMISAYYAGTGQRELGFSACERLAARRGHSPSHYAYVACNETFYVSNLESRQRGTFSVSSAVLDADRSEYVCMNPCIVDWRGDTYVNVRLVNYRQERGRTYASAGPERTIRTRNVTLSWDPLTHRTLLERESTAEIPPQWATDTPVQGLEDMRWVVHEDRIWFTAATWQVAGANGKPRMVLGRMNEALDAVEHLVALQYERAAEVEKNWVPWSLDGALCVIYSYDPFVVLRVDPGSGRTATLSARPPPFYAGRFRGSAAPIRIPGSRDRWLSMVHEVTRYTNENVYTHRFIEIDASLELTRRSRPFVFDHRGIEYAAGLRSSDDAHLIVTYGHEDREARFIELEWEKVVSALS